VIGTPLERRLPMTTSVALAALVRVSRVAGTGDPMSLAVRLALTGLIVAALTALAALSLSV
jgi:hypothetical protein